MPREIKDRLEILSKTPGWFTRSGSLLLLILVLIIVTGAYLIKYPDIISAKIIITTPKLPTAVTARQNGYLKLLTVEDGDEIGAGEMVGVITSSSRAQSVFKARLLMEDIKSTLTEDNVRQVPFIDSLGTLSNSFTNVIASHNELIRILNDPLFDIKKRRLDSDVIRIREVIARTKKQISTTNNTLRLSRSQFKRDSTLLAQKVIATQDFENTKKTFLADQQRSNDLLSELRINNAELSNLSIQREELIATRLENLKQSRLEVRKAIDLALNEINSWDQNFVLRAPIKGTVSYFKLLDENQFINAGDELMVILPRKEELFGICETPSSGFGKIEVGQQVNIRLDNFPYQEFGNISGRVIGISEVARDGNYMVKVELPDQLMTNYGNELSFTQEMSGTAQILTKELRLIERILSQFKLWYSRK